MARCGYVNKMRAIAGRRADRRWLDSLLIVAAAAVSSAVFQLDAIAADQPGEQPPLNPNRMMVQAIHEKTGEPLSGVDFEVQAGGVPKKNLKLTTDAAGECVLEYPPDVHVEHFRMDAKPPGFVPIHVHWSGDPQPVTFPRQYVIRFQQGTTIGGVIRDSQGQPVRDAAVEILIPATESDMKSYYYYLSDNIRSGADGRWRCDAVPEKMPQAIINVTHADFLHTPINAEQSRTSLRDLTLVTTLARGPSFAGQVTSAGGEPISGAKILLGNSHYDQHKREALTDDQGRFELKNCKVGPQFVSVQADGFAPELQRVTVSEKNEPLVLRLGPPGTFRFRIVDADGEAVPGASFYPDHFRNQQMLDTQLHADQSGRMEWKNGPREEMQFDILKGGYLSRRRVPVRPSDDECTVILYPEFVMRGTVDDAETGQRVPEFQVFSAWSLDPKPNWDRYHLAKYQNGQFEFKFDEFLPAYRLRIEAEGYQAAESPDFTAAEHPLLFDFKLRKQSLASAVVRKPDGSPAAGATVVLLAQDDSQYAQFSNGRFAGYPDVPSMTTGADGVFSFATPTAPYQLVALHDDGYADAAVRVLAGFPDLKLQPWGRMEGTLKVGSRTAANEQIRFNPEGPPLDGQSKINHDYTTKSDASGHFVLERVAPRSGWLSHILVTATVNGQATSPLRSQTVDVKPGETTQVVLGGTGRPAIGRVVATNQDGTPFKWPESELGTLTLDRNPAGAAALAAALAQRILGSVMPNRKSSEATTGWYRFAIRTDGTFRAEDLPAGNYKLSIRMMSPRNQFDAMGAVSLAFTIPEIPQGRSDEPLDLGVLTAKLFKVLNIGDVAPAFAVKTLDGQGVELAQHQGQVVLLTFWATSSPTSVKELSDLEKLNESFSSDPKFAMFGVSLDDKATALRTAKANKLALTRQSAVGANSSVAEDFGVRAVPEIFVIGPDGKVIAKGLHGDALREAVRQALEKLKT